MVQRNSAKTSLSMDFRKWHVRPDAHRVIIHELRKPLAIDQDDPLQGAVDIDARLGREI